MMASVSDNICNLTGVFTIPSPNHDDPASFNWLLDADALGRLCHILCAIAVISAPSTENRYFGQTEWTNVRIAVLDALQRVYEAQALRLAFFQAQ
jgi:hypothetical protein